MKSLSRMSLFCALLFATTAVGAEHSTLIGTVVDGDSQQPLANVQVFVNSPELRGEHVGVTDVSGHYRITHLPAGVYALRLVKEHYEPDTRQGIELRRNRTVRYDVRMSAACTSDCATAEVLSIRVRYPAPRIAKELREQLEHMTLGRTRLYLSREHCFMPDDVVARTPSWMLSRSIIQIPDGTPQLVYRAPSAEACSPDFRTTARERTSRQPRRRTPPRRTPATSSTCARSTSPRRRPSPRLPAPGEPTRTRPASGPSRGLRPSSGASSWTGCTSPGGGCPSPMSDAPGARGRPPAGQASPRTPCHDETVMIAAPGCGTLSGPLKDGRTSLYALAPR
ncbi:carboxypeptidase regulatory-like domain-containing protein [Pyxidicoccus fallax]|uniref:Carboxypeptidase regulatory-like domain-containing protein n=1 Tax=Pyxidicoccus fallax TaxID=394095 RepID=A0A848LFV8_9BACT|nr:carboxypeptidase regulatory-like domain-containing protein [Pyxidicoccus fallax]NPC77626.1 carboxypeptidase regulatory-like domain-containing protein [Pyxidicoccus fallax]